MKQAITVVVPVDRMEWERTAFDLRARSSLRREIGGILMGQLIGLARTRHRVPTGDLQIEAYEQVPPEEVELFEGDVREHPERYIFVRGTCDTKPQRKGANNGR